MKKVVGNPMILIAIAVVVIGIVFLGYSYMNSDIDPSVDLVNSAGVTTITEIPIDSAEDYERISTYLGVVYDAEIKTCIDNLDYKMYEIVGGTKQTIFDDYKTVCINDGYKLSTDQAWTDPGYSAISFYAKSFLFGRLVVVLEPSAIAAGDSNSTVSGGTNTNYYPITSDYIVITSDGFLSGYSKCKIGE